MPLQINVSLLRSARQDFCFRPRFEELLTSFYQHLVYDKHSNYRKYLIYTSGVEHCLIGGKKTLFSSL